MAAGQLALALSTDFTTALLARVLVGAGDAMTFISVLRLVSAWFPARRIPVMSQFTGIVGQLGQVLSAVPLVALLHGPAGRRRSSQPPRSACWPRSSPSPRYGTRRPGPRFACLRPRPGT